MLNNWCCRRRLGSALLLFAAFELAVGPLVGGADEKSDEPPPATADAGKLVEPPFPRLFYNPVEEAPIRPRRAKIVTETIGSDWKRTNEEYLDLDLGRSAYLVQNGFSEGINTASELRTNQMVLLANAHTKQLFKYRPYACETWSMNDQSVSGLDFWSVTLDLGASETSPREPLKLRVFGLAAMWLFAAANQKSYARATLIYSANKDIYRVAHNWTVEDANSNVNIRFFFLSSTFNKNSANDAWVSKQINTQLSLELVELESRSSGLVLRTINVLSLDYELGYDVYENILEVPVGYGCQTNDLVTPTASDDGDNDDGDGAPQNKFNIDNELQHNNEFWRNFLWTSARVELEVSATRVNQMDNNQRATDTVYVELAHLPMRSGNTDYDLMMTKIKSGEAELKTITDHLYQVRYQIDLQKSSCRMSHVTTGGGGGGGGRDDDSLVLKFSNGLELSLERDQMEMLFASKEKFQLIKRTKRFLGSNKQVTRVYMERSIAQWPYKAGGNGADSDRVAREMRTLLHELAEDDQGQKRFSARLESITIWVLDAASQSHISEIYHLNVIDEEAPLSSWPDVGRLFDVSQECYLDNERMRAGTDFAWIQLFYPVASRQLDSMLANELELKKVIHEKLVSQYQLTSFRAPRLELMFSDQGLVVRALLLDLPPIELLYERHERQMIVLEEEARGDLALVAPDTRHCSQLCQMYACKSMSFCFGTRACLLGMEAVREPAPEDPELARTRQRLKPNRACTTFGLATRDERLLLEHTLKRRLAGLLSFMAHQDYSLQEVPKAPEELSLPRDETGLTSDADYKRLIAAYLLDVTEYLTHKGTGAPTLVISLLINDHFTLLMPAKFTLENDPLAQFDIPGRVVSSGGGGGGGDQDDNNNNNNADDDDDLLLDSAKVAAFFHEGLALTRFKFNSFQGSLRDRSSLLTGLAYDRCALACLDAKCGTFSFCPTRKECIITPLSTIREASQSQLLEDDGDCFVSQRDFVKNFRLFPDVLKPEEFESMSEVESVADCALACLTSGADWRCMSFEFCQEHRPRLAAASHANICYLQRERRPDELFSEQTEDEPHQEHGGRPPATNATQPAGARCQHYERSHLAEFNQIEARQVDEALLAQLKTTQYTGALTPMDCADICLEQLADCSAFQLCFEAGARSAGASKLPVGSQLPTSPRRSAATCTMIQSKPEDAQQQKELEVLVDARSDQLVGSSKYLEFSAQCWVFALRADTVQAHLRDLAMGNTRTLEQERQLEAMRHAGGLELSLVGYICLILSVALASAMLGVGLCYAHERNQFLRERIERARLLVGL